MHLRRELARVELALGSGGAVTATAVIIDRLTYAGSQMTEHWHSVPVTLPAELADQVIRTVAEAAREVLAKQDKGDEPIYTPLPTAVVAEPVETQTTEEPLA